MPWWAVFLIATGVAALVALAGAFLLAVGLRLARRQGLLLTGDTRRRTGPDPPQPLAASVAEALGELAAVRAEWAAHRKQLDAYLDAFEDLEESTERRRRRAASSRSKAERAVETLDQGGAVELHPNSREAIRARARARGFRV